MVRGNTLFFSCLLYVLFAAGLFSLPKPAHAQNASLVPSYQDSLRGNLPVKKRLQLLKDLSFNYSVSIPDSGLYYGRMALRLSQKEGIADWEAHAQNSIGFCFIKKGQFDSADIYLHLALKYFIAQNIPCDIGAAYFNLGNLYYSAGNMAEALDGFTRYEEIASDCPAFLQENPGGAAHSIGIIYNAQGQYEKAIPFFQKSIAANNKTGNQNREADGTLSLGNACLGLKKYSEAFGYYRRAEALYRKNDNTNGLALTAENMGLASLAQDQYRSALVYFQQALTLFSQLGSEADQCYELQQIGETYLAAGNSAQSVVHYQKALQLAEANDLENQLPELHYSLSAAYEKQSDYRKALFHQKIATSLQDSLNLIDQQARLDELTTQYEARQKDKEILLLSRTNELQSIKASQQEILRDGLIFTLVLLAILAFVLLNRYNLKRRTALSLEEKNALIEQQKQRAVSAAVSGADEPRDPHAPARPFGHDSPAERPAPGGSLPPLPAGHVAHQQRPAGDCKRDPGPVEN